MPLKQKKRHASVGYNLRCRNKHIFPASRWEVYDPTKAREKYTIHDSA